MTPPLRGSSAGSHFFGGAGARAAELKLAYAVEQGLEVAILVGAPGLGKTSLLRRIASRAADGGHAVVDVFFPRLDAEELLDFIDSELADDSEPKRAGSESRVRRIAARMRSLATEDRGLLVAIDDAHLLRGPAAFETLHLLLNLREREGIRLTLLLAGQPCLLPAIEKSAALAQRVAVTAALSPMTRDETGAFVRHHLVTGGYDTEALEGDALVALHDHAAGVPRTANRLCEMALLIAATEGRDRITAADIDTVGQECLAFRDAA